MNRILRKALCVMLTLVLAASACANAFAAGEEQYVSELVIAFGDSGKAELEKAGYQVKDYNLNNGATFMDGTAETSVWLGYKTTTDPDEAITDMAVMNMNGGYSFSNYEAVVENQKEQVAKAVEKYRIAIDEFRVNYEAGFVPAATALKVLNLWYEDDTEQALGDFFVNPETTDEQLRTLFLEGNSEYLGMAQQFLAIGLSENENGNIFTRLEEMDIEDEYPKDLAAIVRALYNEISNVKLQLSDFYEVKEAIAGEITDQAVSDYLTANAEALGDDKLYSIEQGYSIWKNTKDADYAGSGITLLQLFEMDMDYLSDKWLNPLAAALSKGQAECIKICGLSFLLATSVMSDEEWEKAIASQEETIAELKGETLSVYNGIDRTVFTPDGIALTEEAAKASSNDSGTFWATDGDGGEKDKDGGMSGGEIAALAGAAAAGVIGIVLLSLFIHDFMEYSMFKLSVMFIKTFTESFWAGFVFVVGMLLVLGCIAYFLLRYVFDVIKFDDEARQQILDKEYDHTRKPRIMVTEEEDPNGKISYVYYYAVRDLDGEIADLNGGSTKNPQWNVLYTTKNKYMGDPIRADFVLQESDKAPSGYSPVHNFDKGTEGEKGAYNLSNGVARATKNVYMFVAHVNPSGLVGSGFAASSAILTALAAFFVGGGLSAAIVSAVQKKKREQTA